MNANRTETKRETKGEPVNGKLIAVQTGLRLGFHAYQPYFTVELSDGRTAYWWTDETTINLKGIAVGAFVKGFARTDEFGDLNLYRVRTRAAEAFTWTEPQN